MRGLTRSLIALLGVAALSVGMAACGGDDDDTSGDSGSSEVVKLRLGYVTTPQHPYGIAVTAFEKEVEAAAALFNPITDRGFTDRGWVGHRGSVRVFVWVGLL